MPRYKFSEFAYNINQKKVPEPGDEEMYIGLEHLDSGSLKVRRWGSDVPITGEKLVMKKGDILFGRRNTYLRRAAIAPHNGIFSAHGMIFRPNTEVMDPDYFPFFISSDYFMNAAIRISVGSLSPTVNWKTLKDLEFDIPDIDSQRKSAVLLTAANELREAYEALLQQTDELVKSQFIEMFLEGNKEYPIKKLTDVCKEIVAGGDKPKDISTEKNEEYPYPVYANAETDEGLLCYSRTYRIENAGVTIAARGCTVGFTAVRAGKYTPVVRLIALTPGSQIDPIYLKHYLDITGLFLSTGSAQPQITIPSVKNIEMAVPPIEQQREYADFVRQSDKSK